MGLAKFDFSLVPNLVGGVQLGNGVFKLLLDVLQLFLLFLVKDGQCSELNMDIL